MWFDSGSIDVVKQLPKAIVVLFLWEPPVVISSNEDRSLHRYFSRVYIQRDDWVDNEFYFKFYNPIPHFEMTTDVIPFNEKKLCHMMAANKTSSHAQELYSERVCVINFFEHNHPDEFDLYGSEWGDCGYKTYRGFVPRKIVCSNHYKFAFTYENMLFGG